MSHYYKKYGPNMVSTIRALETKEELVKARAEIITLYEAGSFSTRTAKRIEKAINARWIEVSSRLIERPPSGRLLVPTHLSEGKVLVGLNDGQPEPERKS